ncbi:DUF4365 domain-containing protein [Phycisphaerales bacterium AB-hyl4]|uniref:DUF4365 domain-containing protein n=1 Tax=Natronomicrosphaera hydrolytica TaxID=3242702 RepID=A0ABV4U700_9BACT
MKAKETERTDRRGVALVMSTFESLGFAFREQSESDYGIDGHAELIDDECPTGQLLGIQIKTGASYLSERNDTTIVFRADADHVEYWLNHALPVIICICDPDNRTIYWQAVTKETAISTGKGYRFDLPITQTLDGSSIQKVADLLTPLVPPDRYTIFKTEDISHGLAKRYSFKVVINGYASKAEIASIIRQVTMDGTKRQYHRNHLVAGRWSGADAHVVWTFVYPSAEDEARCNHICRSLWIDESLDGTARPVSIKGENIGEGIIVEWRKDYSFLARHTSTNTMTKEDYFGVVISRIHELKQLLSDIESHLRSLEAGNITEGAFIDATDGSREQINDIYMSISEMPHAPFECKEMDKCLESFIASMHNIYLLYSDNGRQTRTAHNRLVLSLQQRTYAREQLGELEYEMRKIR